MNRIPCYMVEFANESELYLSKTEEGQCPLGHEHRASRAVKRFPRGEFQENSKPYWNDPGNPAWPTRCECGHFFTVKVRRSSSGHTIARRADTGEEINLGSAPSGAMWYADWLEGNYSGPDGKVLLVKTPGGDWNIDSRASNCTMPDDKTHRCWVRHGEPPNVTVDKDGHTCGAGAGSIQCGNYHGFLRGGFLEEC